MNIIPMIKILNELSRRMKNEVEDLTLVKGIIIELVLDTGEITRIDLTEFYNQAKKEMELDHGEKDI